jgi:hypothetical protein
MPVTSINPHAANKGNASAPYDVAMMTVMTNEIKIAGRQQVVSVMYVLWGQPGGPTSRFCELSV